MEDIAGVIDIVETKDSQTDGKYFFIVESSKMAKAEYEISQVIRALNVRLRNPANSAVLEHYHEYPTLKLGISAGRYIEQSAARFADLFNDGPLTSSSIRQNSIQKMSFTIDNNVQFPQMKKQVAWIGNNKDDGTIDSNKLHKSATDVTKVSLALTIATFESKMTTSFIQMREYAREDQKADRVADRERDKQMEKIQKRRTG